MAEEVKFSIPKSVKSNEPMFKSFQEMIVVKLMAPHLSINGAKKCGILNQSTGNCYDHIANLGKLFISGKLSLKYFLKNLEANTNISDGTLLKRTGKNIYAAKKLKIHSKGCYGIYQDILLTVRRYKGINFITAFKNLRLYIYDKSFKDTLDGLSSYLLSKRPPKAAALMEAALKEASANIGYDGVNKMNDCLIEAILISG